jgi:hypothetical protein
MKLHEGSYITLGVVITLITGVVWSVWVVASLDSKVQDHSSKLDKLEAIGDRTTRIETKVDLILERMNEK